jgi:presequence protease
LCVDDDGDDSSLFLLVVRLLFLPTNSNEMKGVYSSADSLLNRASQRSLFTDNTYAVDSGGDPAAIPDLSFDQFRDFHRKYYHPSNSRIFFAGDDDVYKRLDVMDEYLDNFEASDEYREKSAIPFQRKALQETVRVVETYPAGADQPATHMFTMNWLLNDEPLTETEELTMALLDHLLLGTTSSVLRKTLMESGLGEAITGGGLSDELLQATFSIGMKGVKGDEVAKCEQLILDTINKVVADGFTSNEIEASMNTIEFSLREFNTGSFPKFLSFGLAANSKWLYDRSPTDALKFEAPLADLKLQIKTHGSKVFQNIMKKFIVDNTHRSIVELKPSRTMEQEQLDEERGRLEKIQEGLSVTDRNGIISGAAELKRRQAQEDPPEARATIPSLQLIDLKRQATEYPIKVSENEMGTGITVVRHEMGSTSGIAYVALAVDLSKIPLEDVPLLPLFTQMMRETGAGDLDSVGLSQMIGTHSTPHQ